MEFCVQPTWGSPGEPVSKVQDINELMEGTLGVMAEVDTRYNQEPEPQRRRQTACEGPWGQILVVEPLS